MLKNTGNDPPQMNADKRQLKTTNLSSFIWVYRRPICLSQQPGKFPAN
jgi:hypothetical protein